MENGNFWYFNTNILENLTKESSEFKNLSTGIAKDVVTNKISVLEVIKNLGCLLTNPSFSRREVGVLILGESLQNLSQNFSKNIVDSKELLVLSAYFSEKLKDHHQVAASSLKGVLALLTFPNVPNESVINLVSSIFNHIICQQQQQQDRYIIYQIYERVLVHYRTVVESMGMDFVYGVLSSIDGERDPKNLLYLFDWLESFLKIIKLGHLSEEMFDVLACYFPVDFKAPPTDKNKITREDLATRLCQCLTSTPEFGTPGIILALEKLDSALKIAKEDSLELLKRGCKYFNTSVYFDHSVEIWSQIQKEIFNTTDEDFKRKCLETLKELISKMSQGESEQFDKIINDISDTLKGNLIPDSKLFNSSMQILLTVAQASQKSSIVIAKKVLPLLENTFKITLNAEQKSDILSSLIAFTKAVIDNNIHINYIEEIQRTPRLCIQAILDENESLRKEGFMGLTEIVQFLTEEEKTILFESFRKFIVTPQKRATKNSFLKCLKIISKLFPKEIQEKVLYNVEINDLQSLDFYLGYINHLVDLHDCENYIMNTLLKYTLDSIDKSNIALRHLNNILMERVEIAEMLIIKDFIPNFINYLKDLENSNDDFLNNVNLVLQGIIREQESDTQKCLYVSESGKQFKNDRVYVTVLSGFISPMKRGVFNDYDKSNLLIDHSFRNNDPFIRNISLEVLANILNKLDNADVLCDILDRISHLCDECTDEESKVLVISWVSKSLVTRNHLVSWQWVDKLMKCLNGNMIAAKGFRIIMDTNIMALSTQNDCQVMPLYKQKFFLYVTNKINENSSKTNIDHFTVVGYLLENIPKHAILGQFKKILRLILLGLEKSGDAEILQIIIQMINDFVKCRESVVEENLEDIFLRILGLTSFESSMKVRIASIICIQQFALTYPVYKLLPYQQLVINQLGKCVDDRKRLVRREAMTCRSLWYLLDAPE